MQIHMEFDWFSADHLFWASAIALPILIIWVIGWPAAALIMILRSRHKLEDQNVKKYLLILYQGLKNYAFYWEFVNTLKKLLLLWIIVFWSLFSVTYQILLWTSLMIVLLRIQIKLQPYKLKCNNEIEAQAMIAGIVTLLSGWVFASDSIPNGLRAITIITLFAFNSHFIVNWSYLFLLSFGTRSRWLTKIIKVYSALIWKKHIAMEYNGTTHPENSLNTKKVVDGVVKYKSKVKKLRKKVKKINNRLNDESKFTLIKLL